ncbi:MAG: 2-oxoglutarate dehydrogenase E1 component [Alphaproteobacteria bacterium]|nr:2-oxoglutarate dehydrogenase E1 component [Alphaproteobacteria bacterium]
MALDRDSLLNSANAIFIAELYGRYLNDPRSVDSSWADFFKSLDDDSRTLLLDSRGASWAPRDSAVIGAKNGAAAPAAAKGGVSADQLRAACLDSIRARILIRSYRVRGHLEATLDPLGLEAKQEHLELHPRTLGFTDADYDRPIFVFDAVGVETATLRELIARLRAAYCGTIGIEYMHMQDPEQKDWIQERVEAAPYDPPLSADEKKWILKKLTVAETFEQFLDKRYTGTKRFGLDGGESSIPALEAVLERAAQHGVEEVVLGMAHRGRLNVLANVMRKPFQAIFSEFEGHSANPEDVQGSGDVKYHLGTSSDREILGRKMHLSLQANPSHLEAADPVVMGRVRAKQTQKGDMARERVMGLLIHGDAAFAGQGLVAEVLGYSDLKGYRTGGTIHLIINNQIGFTTSPSAGRSSSYCSDIAKAIQAPIFHVNGDDPEAVLRATRLATDFRQKFHKDVVIDLFCYRRHGHNEGDEPSFTQPIMYRKIAAQPTTRQIYAKRLVQEGVVDEAAAEGLVTERFSELDKAFEIAKTYKPNKADWLEGAWTGMRLASADDRRGETAVPLDELRAIGRKICTIPEGFDANRKVVRIVQGRLKAIETGEGIDWATAEALAFGTLCAEGTPVRLSGQDSGRGTFSQRHAVLIDQMNEDKYVSIAHIKDGQAPIEIIDSPLAEGSVLGFEYGYSLAEPKALVLWEAQFGDFANGAQVIIDQFISSGESKWLRMSGLVMLLPHGHEGQGPEHSSARLERYLQLCAEDNMQVVNITSPANYFHALRRQIRRDFRKPLIVMTPKSLLRHKLAVSKLESMGPGKTFHRILVDRGDPLPDKDIKRVVLCSGKVFYDLFETREQIGAKQAYLLRVEQLYPFPGQVLANELKRFPNAEVVWCQEEPKNMGAWTFVEPRLETVLAEGGTKSKRPRYIGRAEAASPATGSAKRHAQEQQALVKEALTF